MNGEAAPPQSEGRRFYEIRQREDGHVDVYLFPPRALATDCGSRVSPASCPDGRRLQAQSPQAGTLGPILGHLIVVWGVEPRDDLEDDIRLRYGAWCASGEVIV